VNPNFKFDRGGTPAEMGPFVGVVKNNVDPTRSGRLYVYIEQFGTDNPDDKDTGYRPVNYLPPFYGVTEKNSTSAGSGTYPGNQQSYGMWFTPPDIGTKCCVSLSTETLVWDTMWVHTRSWAQSHDYQPWVRAPKSQYVTGNKAQAAYFANSPQLPVTEINTDNKQIDQSPKFFDQPKPVHSVQAAIYFQQGLDNDPERGPIGSNAQRESPSTVYGISTPGKPVYAGGQDPNTIRKQLSAGGVRADDVKVIGRQGGHTLGHGRRRP
jgi:hypothetical protein